MCMDVCAREISNLEFLSKKSLLSLAHSLSLSLSVLFVFVARFAEISSGLTSWRIFRHAYTHTRTGIVNKLLNSDVDRRITWRALRGNNDDRTALRYNIRGWLVTEESGEKHTQQSRIRRVCCILYPFCTIQYDTWLLLLGKSDQQPRRSLSTVLLLFVEWTRRVRFFQTVKVTFERTFEFLSRETKERPSSSHSHSFHLTGRERDISTVRVDHVTQ